MALSDFELHVLANNRQTKIGFRARLISSKIWKRQYPKLTIVCIDNAEFNKHAPVSAPCDPNDRDKLPRLSREATGIPELRSIISDYPADGRWERLKHHINETWECTMNSLEMSGTITIAQRKAEVDEQFDKTCRVCGDLCFISIVLTSRRKLWKTSLSISTICTATWNVSRTKSVSA